MLEFAVGQEPERVLLARPIPLDGDPWGEMAPLLTTPWARHIREIPWEVLHQATLGWVTPLRRALGDPPEAAARRLPAAAWRCANATDRSCPIVEAHCLPGRKMPFCYVAPHPDPNVSGLLSHVARCWAENRYVIIVTGEPDNAKA